MCLRRDWHLINNLLPKHWPMMWTQALSMYKILMLIGAYFYKYWNSHDWIYRQKNGWWIKPCRAKMVRTKTFSWYRDLTLRMSTKGRFCKRSTNGAFNVTVKYYAMKITVILDVGRGKGSWKNKPTNRCSASQRFLSASPGDPSLPAASASDSVAAWSRSWTDHTLAYHQRPFTFNLVSV